MAAANYSSFNAPSFLSLFFLFVAFQIPLNILGSLEDDFYVDIIHRDSPESPLYDPSSTPFSCFQAAVNRSASRLHYLRHARFLDSLSIPLINDNFEFLMVFYIGSESKKVYAGVDTGSELIWMLCNPCPNCYEHVPNIFDPLSSESYRKLDCNIPPCTKYHKWKCNNENRCEYHASYIDDSFVKGILSTETLKFNVDTGKENYALHNVIFGCTHKTKGEFDRGSIGLVGLNRGDFSLTNQLGPSIVKMFSYCLPSKMNQRTRLYFGKAAIVSGPGTMITPMYHGFEADRYYLLLQGIKVGNEPILVSPDPQEGNTILDTGAALTFIQPNLLRQIINQVKKRIPLPLEHNDTYDACFNTSSLTKPPVVPRITFMFDNNVEFVPSKHGVFQKIDKNIMCFLMVSTNEHDGLQIIGNRVQAGYRIGFDIHQNTITIRKENC